jgi:hypothetical protein
MHGFHHPVEAVRDRAEPDAVSGPGPVKGHGGIADYGKVHLVDHFQGIAFPVRVLCS